MKTLVSRFRGSIIYCEGERSNQSKHICGKHRLWIQASRGMLLSAYAKLMAENNKEVVILDSEDIDVYVQAAYVSHQLQGNLLIKHKKEYISCSAMLAEDVANIIIPLHVITGSDHTSAFFGHGKKKVLQKVNRWVRDWSYETKSKLL